MKKLIALISFALLPCAAFAADGELSPFQKLGEQAIRDFVGDCPGTVTVTSLGTSMKLPTGFRSSKFKVESDSPYCAGTYTYVSAPGDEHYVGNPWTITGVGGTTIEEKLKKFGWQRLNESFDPVVYRDKLVNGLYRAEMRQTTEQGKVALSGFVDPEGTVFLLGNFYKDAKPTAEQRLGNIAAVAQSSPAKGPANAKVTIHEFSDFECPSCRAAATYMKPILEKYKDQIRYVRMDLPLVSMHPWAFSAALYGRAIWKQSPEAFWQYKESVYSNQEKLNSFALEDFAHGFVEDHNLDRKKFDADVTSDALRNELLKSMSVAYSVPVLSTPTFLVNGKLVAPGTDGEHIAKYIDALLAAK